MQMMKRLLAITVLALIFFGPIGLEGETVRQTVGTATTHCNHWEEAKSNMFFFHKRVCHTITFVEFDGKKDIVRASYRNVFPSINEGVTRPVIVIVRKMKNWIGFPKGEKIFIRELPKKERV